MTARAGKVAKRKLSRTHRPEGMSVEEWQRELRREFAREQRMKVRNLGEEPVFSEFAVTNPATQRTYRVVIRGEGPGVNYCSCPDYAVNTLGTCKHVEVVLNKLRKRNARALRQGYSPPFAEVYVRYGTQRAVMFSPGRGCPEGLVKLAGEYFGRDGQLKTAAFDRFSRFVQQAGRFDHALKVYDDALAMVAEVRDAHARQARLAELLDGQAGERTWRDLLKVSLYAYQRAGALFAARAGRAIIADEMGLGKTVQAIAAVELLARACGVERVLIVCPTSLKSQWHQEIGRFCGRPAMIVEGPTHRRRGLYEQRDGAFYKIANYDVVHRDLEAIRAWGPDVVILDEAQRIKNWQTRAARTVKRIDSRYCLVLTGTPLENRIEELHSIVEFVDRFRLGPLFAFKAAHEVCAEDSARVVGYRDLHRIHRTLAPILIRRTKQEVLNQLPPRMDKNFFVPMTDQQWVPHRENQEIVARLVAKWHRYRFLTETDQLRLRIALQNMRMACDSTYLIDHQTRYHTKLDELATLLAEIFEERSAKVVIFSQWVRMNELIEELFKERGWGHVHLHGGVPGPQRKELTRALREDPDCRAFLSTDAGGVGLNLQAASTVINMDLPWNPAVLEQRIGRAHRLGQERPVRVVNFISEGTIEHGMLSLLAFKRSMFAGVVEGQSDEVFMGDSALNRFMKTVETATASVPQVVPTPAEEPVEEGQEEVGVEAAEAAQTTPGGGGAAAMDVRVLGDLLARGAEFLKNLGQSLSSPAGGRREGKPRAAGPAVHRDPATGLSELRIPLPDPEALQQWAGLLVGLLGAK